MSSRLSLSIIAALATLVVSSPARAGADEICVEQAHGVPGATHPYPEWWDSALDENQREVRWTGATAVNDEGLVAVGTPPLGSGRVTWDKPSRRLFFEFEVHSDPALDANQDLVMLSLSDATGTEPELYIQFQPLQACSTVSDCENLGTAVDPSSIKYSQATVTTSVTWSPLSSVNPSSDWTVTQPWVEVEPYVSGGNTRYRWRLKFALEIPVDAGSGEARPDQRIYGNAVMYMPGLISGTAVEFPLLCEPSSPISNDCLVFNSTMSAPPADLPLTNLDTIWSHVSTGNLALCDGVEVIKSLVGSDFKTVFGTVPGTSILYRLPGSRIPRFSGARLRAGFDNDGPALSAGDIEAEFRIANWGLQWSTWDQATWTPVETAVLSGSVSAGGYGGAFGQGALESGLWIPASSGLPLTNDHQCMHVRLTSGGGAVDFKRDSVYRNMDLVNASVFRRPIDMDMTGREPRGGKGGDDVYLMVDTRNMPSVEQCEQSDQTLRGCGEGGPLVLGPADGSGSWDAKGELGELDELGESPVGEDEVAEYGKDIIGLDELARYVVYALEDTGGVINLPEAPATPVLKLFSSYGYFVQHEGEPSQGWQHYLTAPGAEPVPGTPDLFRMRVQSDQVVALSDTVRVVDGVQERCDELPSTEAVMPLEEEMARTEELIGDGFEGHLAEQVVDEPDLGCEPPPLREPCVREECAPHNPISYLDGSRYVGEWYEEALAGVYPGGLPEHIVSPAATGSSEAEAATAGIDVAWSGGPGEARDGCCGGARVDPRADRRGAARLTAMALVLLWLRRGRRRRRRG